MRILGIDPGSAVTGFGVIDAVAGRLRHVAHGTLRPPQGASPAERLQYLYEGVQSVLREHEPDSAAVEQVFVSASPRSALVLGQARGAVLASLGAGSAGVSEYAATSIKQAVTGSGRAGKRQVQHMVRRLLQLDRDPVSDAADALATAICHAHHGARARFAARRSRRPSLRVGRP